jgi:hypothetical protein
MSLFFQLFGPLRRAGYGYGEKSGSLMQSIYYYLEIDMKAYSAFRENNGVHIIDLLYSLKHWDFKQNYIRRFEFIYI